MSISIKLVHFELKMKTDPKGFLKVSLIDKFMEDLRLNIFPKDERIYSLFDNIFSTLTLSILKGNEKL